MSYDHNSSNKVRVALFARVYVRQGYDTIILALTVWFFKTKENEPLSGKDYTKIEFLKSSFVYSILSIVDNFKPRYLDKAQAGVVY